MVKRITCDKIESFAVSFCRVEGSAACILKVREVIAQTMSASPKLSFSSKFSSSSCGRRLKASAFWWCWVLRYSISKSNWLRNRAHRARRLATRLDTCLVSKIASKGWSTEELLDSKNNSQWFFLDLTIIALRFRQCFNTLAIGLSEPSGKRWRVLLLCQRLKHHKRSHQIRLWSRTWSLDKRRLRFWKAFSCGPQYQSICFLVIRYRGSAQLRN